MKYVKFDRRGAFSRVGALIALFTLVACPACRRNDASSQLTEAAQEKTVRPIQSFVVPKGENAEVRTFPVVIKEGTSAKLSFRVPGKLENFDVTPGRRFKEGEVVAQLERRDYQLIVDRCKQALVEANAALKAMETGARPEDLASAEAGYEAAKSQRETAERPRSA